MAKLDDVVDIGVVLRHLRITAPASYLIRLKTPKIGM
jgi:hypothetical protein